MHHFIIKLNNLARENSATIQTFGFRIILSLTHLALFAKHEQNESFLCKLSYWIERNTLHKTVFTMGLHTFILLLLQE